MELVQVIVCDGEGVIKFVIVQVNGGVIYQECLDVGYVVVYLLLIKIVLFVFDLNWGCIFVVVGCVGVVNLDVSKIDVFFGDVCIVSCGGWVVSYIEEQGVVVMVQVEIGICIELGCGICSEIIWIIDLFYEYVKINVEYCI